MYKQIYLPAVKTFVYTISKNRQANISETLNRLDFTNWEFIYRSNENSLDWIKLLETPAPFLILEDDATLTDNYHAEINYPDDAELLYFGGSTHGELYHLHKISEIVHKKQQKLIVCTGLQSWWPEFLLYTDRDDDYICPYNMHSTHAILLLNDNVKNLIKQIINSELAEAVHRLFANNMHLFNTYCLKKPFWYKCDGENNIATLTYYGGKPIDKIDILKFRSLKYAYYAKSNGTKIEDNRFKKINGVFENPNHIDVTEELNYKIKQGMLVGDRFWNLITICNDTFGQDPFPGYYKFLHLKYNSGAWGDHWEGKTIIL